MDHIVLDRVVDVLPALRLAHGFALIAQPQHRGRQRLPQGRLGRAARQHAPAVEPRNQSFVFQLAQRLAHGVARDPSNSDNGPSSNTMPGGNAPLASAWRNRSAMRA